MADEDTNGFSGLAQITRDPRVQNIQDMYGKRPVDIGTFLKQQGIHTQYGKAFGWGAIGTALGAIAGFLMGKASVIAEPAYAGIEPTYAILYAFLGCIGGAGASLLSDLGKNGKSYDRYVTDFANKARESHEKQLAASINRPITVQEPVTKDKQWAENVIASRTQTTNPDLKEI